MSKQAVLNLPNKIEIGALPKKEKKYYVNPKPFSEYTDKDWKQFYEAMDHNTGYSINGYMVSREEWEEFHKQHKEFLKEEEKKTCKK